MTIKERVKKPEDFKYIYGDFPVEFVYTAGNALEPFLSTIKEKGKFTGRRCDACGITYVPPATFCERCFARLNRVVNIGNDGTVESFTVSYLDVDGNRLKEPEVWGLVRLNGASTMFLHRLLCKPKAARIGMKVNARFKPKNKRMGRMDDIEGFAPAR